MRAWSQEVNAGEFERHNSFVMRTDDVFNLNDHQRQLLTKQVAERQALISCVNQFIDKLPSPQMDIDDAVDQDYVTPHEVADFYLGLTRFLRDPQAAHIVLYMPFEWLPTSLSQTPDDDDELAVISAEFREAYVETWWSLLREQEVRAHYDDGDMRLDIDSDTGKLPRVVKAAHLIPFLLAKDIISEDDVEYIYRGTNSEVLRASIDDARQVYRHLHEDVSTDVAAVTTRVTPESVYAYHEQQLAQMHIEREADASPQRLEWLEKVAYELTAQDTAAILDIDSAAEFLESDDELLRSAGYIALGRFVEAADTADIRSYALSALLESGSREVKYYSMTLIRLYHGGFIDERELVVIGVRIPKLHGELSQNLDLGDEKMEVVRTYIDTVNGHPELAAKLYPAVLIGGSRLKGYGDEHSDIDVTICVRPGVDASDRDALAAQVLPLLGGDKPHEFWLETEGDGLHIRTIDCDDQFVGNDYWVHVLFGGAWVGDETAIDELQRKLYASYFTTGYLEGTEMPLQPAYLKRIEDDVVLYRLLHRGYAHQFPSHSLTVPGADYIDGNGVFYDAGYRQLATRLFIEKVFLPTL